MSVATLAGTITREAEEAARTGVYDAAKARIEQLPKAGVAAAPGTTAPPPSVAAKNAKSTGQHVGSCIFRDLGIPGSSALCKPGEVAQEGAQNALGSVEGAVGNFAKERGQEVGEGILEWLKPAGTKIGLYAVLILGAVAMMVFGVEQLLKPVGGPDLIGAGKKAAKGAALAGAAE